MGACRHEHVGSAFAPVTKVGCGHEERGQLSLSTCRRLKRNGVESSYFRKDALQTPKHFQHPLEARLGLVGMEVGHTGQCRKSLVALGIVFHRAGTERVKVGIDRHVQRR